MDMILRDIPRIYTALAEWMTCMMYCQIAGNRKMSVKKYSTAVFFLVVHIVYLSVTENVEIIFWFPCMLGAILIMFLFLRYMLDMNACTVIFICARAFLIAEFAASLEWQVHVVLFQNENVVYGFVQLPVAILFYCLIFFLFFFMERHGRFQEYLEYISWKETLTSMLIVGISFAVSNLCFILSPTPYVAGIQNYIFVIRTLVDLCGIIVMYVQRSRIQEVLMEKELSISRRTLKSQYEQYRNYQDSMEMINRKYHDVKHQIEILRAEKDANKRNKWLDELEREFDMLSDVGHTGNSVLDGILVAKMIYCRKNNIKVTYVADGSILGGLHVTDLCTIFGNALDNAIECVSMLDDEKKRLIHFSVTREKGFIFIRMENYCEEEPVIGMDSLPVTKKENKKEHGYGMKSIRMAVEKYQGSMTYVWKDNWFELMILIPYDTQLQVTA